MTIALNQEMVASFEGKVRKRDLMKKLKKKKSISPPTGYRAQTFLQK